MGSKRSNKGKISPEVLQNHKKDSILKKTTFLHRVWSQISDPRHFWNQLQLKSINSHSVQQKKIAAKKKFQNDRSYETIVLNYICIIVVYSASFSWKTFQSFQHSLPTIHTVTMYLDWNHLHCNVHVLSALRTNRVQVPVLTIWNKTMGPGDLSSIVCNETYLEQPENVHWRVVYGRYKYGKRESLMKDYSFRL